MLIPRVYTDSNQFSSNFFVLNSCIKYKSLLACSLRRSQLEAEGRRDVTLHCTPNGNYEPLQCDDGLCWCAEPKTGQPTVIPVPEQDINLLPCCKCSRLGWSSAVLIRSPTTGAHSTFYFKKIW